jgi:ankyrin repeat protein
LGDKSSGDELDAPRGHNLISGGCTVEDTTRHFDEIIPESQSKIFDPAHEVSRYEGIINTLLAAGANLSQIGHESSPALDRAMMFAADQLDDYVTNLLWEISEKTRRDDFPTLTHVAITMMKARRHAETATLGAFFLPRAKETTWETVARLLSDRQFSLITELYKSGADFTSLSTDGVSILHKFVQYGFYELVESCFHPPEAVTSDDGQKTSEKTTHDLESLLMVACRRSTPNMEMIRILVEKKEVDINAQGPNGITALHILAVGRYWWQYALAIPYLVSNGASLEARDIDGCTPLLYSSRKWGSFQAAAMKTLIYHGADVNVVGKHGLSCLSNAAQDEGLVRLLVSHGAEVRPMTIINAIQQQTVDVLRVLLSDKGQPGVATCWKLKLEDAKEMDLDTDSLQTQLIREGHPLFTASTVYMPISERPAENKSLVSGEMMKALMTAGFSPYDTYLFQVNKLHVPYRSSLPVFTTSQAWQEKESESEIMLHSLGGFYHGPLPLADRVVMHEIFSSNLGCFKPILEIPDLDLEFRDKNGETLLLAACQRGPPTTTEDRIPLKLLLERGADPFALDNHGRNAIHHKLGSQAPNSEKLEAIKDLGDAIPHLINQVDAKGYLPLHYGLAAVVREHFSQTEQPDWVDYIISQGADMLAADALGNSALHYLAPVLLGCLGYVGEDTKVLFEKFLDMGLDINTRNEAGQTPMFFLASDRRERPFEEIMSWLDGLGVDWQVKDEQKRSILHDITGEPVKLFKAVMDRGADPLAEDRDGRTSLDLAAAHGNDDVLKLFDREGK